MKRPIEYMIEVMQHFEKGGKVSVKKDHWKFVFNPLWNWATADYRIQDEYTEVRQAWWNGEEIEYFGESSKKWYLIRPKKGDSCSFHKGCWNYRIKPKELSLEEKIKEKYSEFEISLIEDNGYGVLSHNSTGPHVLAQHVLAQSLKGFAGYVYEYLDSSMGVELTPISHKVTGEVLHPVAVIFKKENESND
tara:strand:+ start:66 stop:638 length:573 start_codon:yes stop_codon:yes gene_type:complete